MPQESTDSKKIKRLGPLWRLLIEVGFIVFLFYSNILMGEFVVSGVGEQEGLWAAFRNIFTVPDFIIAVIAAVIGYLVFEFLRNRI